jgi:hypothetical protein
VSPISSACHLTGIQKFLIVIGSNADPALGYARNFHAASINQSAASGDGEAPHPAPFEKAVDDDGIMLLLLASHGGESPLLFDRGLAKSKMRRASPFLSGASGALGPKQFALVPRRITCDLAPFLRTASYAAVAVVGFWQH